MEATLKIKQNLDTNFLKMIAILSMTIDHICKIFIPDSIVLAIIGRIAFPLFAYCLVVSCLYTKDFKKYILRLAAFAILSQPFFNLAFHPTLEQFWRELFSLNIFFTLIAGALAVKGLMDVKKNWWMLALSIVMEIVLGLDYGFYGIILMMLFYLCRNKNWLSVLLVFSWMVCSNGVGDFVVIGAMGFNRQFFAVLALPFIYIHSNFELQVHKSFFYIFYPVHLFILCIVRILLMT